MSTCTWEVDHQLLPTEGKPIVELLTDNLKFSTYDLTKITVSQTFDEFCQSTPSSVQ